MEIAGQIIGFVMGLFFLRLAYKFFDKDKITQSVFAAWAAVFIMLCSFPWFQGWAKSFIASNISSKLSLLGEQVSTVQQTTGEMHNQLAKHQSEIDKHQNDLNNIQSKIEQGQSTVLIQQSQITNQFKQISELQSDLFCSQTNIDAQQKKLSDVESLVNVLFSNTQYEELSGSDTNKVAILNLGGSQQLIFKLNYSPVPNTVQAVAQGGGMAAQIPLLPQMAQTANLLFTRFNSGMDLRGVTFSFRYIKDNRATNLVHNMIISGTNSVLLDGSPLKF